MRALRRAVVLLLALPVVALSTPAAASAAGDDYPWRLDRSGSADAFGFTKRQCVSFVAWRLAQRGTPVANARQGWGDARNWDDAARRLGHGVGRTPVVGAVAHWEAYEPSPLYTGGRSLRGTMSAGGYGHVGWVQHVFTDGSASVVQYNGTGDRTFSTVRVRAPRYLYVGVPAPR